MLLHMVNQTSTLCLIFIFTVVITSCIVFTTITCLTSVNKIQFRHCEINSFSLHVLYIGFVDILLILIGEMPTFLTLWGT